MCLSDYIDYRWICVLVQKLIVNGRWTIVGVKQVIVIVGVIVCVFRSL